MVGTKAELARSIELHGVEAHLSAAATSLSLLTDGEMGRRGRQGPPPPNAFQIAALVVGILDERAQRMELTQSGQALLSGGKRSSNWQRTHDATDAAEDAEAMLHTCTHHDLPPRHGGPGGATQPARKSGRRRRSPGGAVPTQGPADVIGLRGGAQEQIPREERGAANAAHVLRARRHLRHLVPFLLDADAKTAVQKALKKLNDWAREYWGPELVNRRG